MASDAMSTRKKLLAARHANTTTSVPMVADDSVTVEFAVVRARQLSFLFT